MIIQLLPKRRGKLQMLSQTGEVFLVPDVGRNLHEEVSDVVSGQLIRFLDSGN